MVACDAAGSLFVDVNPDSPFIGTQRSPTILNELLAMLP
jgi:hypothetical protein